MKVVVTPDPPKPLAVTPNYLYKLNYDFEYESEGSLQFDVGSILDKAGTNSRIENGNAFSTASHSLKSYAPHNWECLEKFFYIIHQQIIPIWTSWGYFDNMRIYPRESWVNIHKRGGYTGEHLHSPSPLVISCYLKAPKGSGNFLVRDPLEYHRFGTPQEPAENIWKEIPVQTNDVLVFPGWLKHKTQPNNTNEDRIVLSVNYESH